MKHYSHWRQIAAFLFSVIFLTCAIPRSAFAEEEYLPSLYIGNDVWYKDRSVPVLIENDNTFSIPAEAFAALNGVSLKTDEAAGALLLTKGDRQLSCDTENGTVISPSGDKKIAIRKANGTVYLPLHDTCSALGLGFELHSYANEKIAVRIVDGSSLFPFSYLVRMFVAQEEEATRTSYPYAETLSATKTVFIHTESELASLVSATQIPNEKLLVVIDTQILMDLLGSNTVFTANFARLLANNAAIALSGYGDGDTLIENVTAANSKILSVFHRGTYLFTCNSHLTAEDYATLAKAGMIHLSGIVDPNTRNDREENTNAR